MRLLGSYNCSILEKRGNRRLVKLESPISPGGVDVTIVPKVTPQDVLPCHAVVFGGATMRALLEKEKNTSDISEANNATLELKLAGQMAGMKDPGFSLEILAAMAAIGRGQQHSIWNQMKLMLEEWKFLCFQRARSQPCDMCRYQDTQGFHRDKTQKLFCTGTGMQFLNLAQTYSIVRRKAEDDDHIFHLPHNKTTVLQLAKFLPIILDAEERRGIKGKPHVYVTIINSYGLSATDRMIREAVLSIQGGKEYADGRLYIAK